MSYAEWVKLQPFFSGYLLSKINPLRILPAFFIGKFISDALMVHTGKYVAENIDNILHGFLSWQAIVGSIVGIALLFLILFINWRILIQKKKFNLNFRIWK
jgi:membrane protein DedA with SNARE-associated domain